MTEEPTQETPEGVTIPVPSKADVMRDLRKVAKDARDSAAQSDGDTADGQR